MAGPGVVPGFRTLERRRLERFKHLYPERRLQLSKKQSERRAHDAGPDENDICFQGGRIRHAGFSSSPMLQSFPAIQSTVRSGRSALAFTCPKRNGRTWLEHDI